MDTDVISRMRIEEADLVRKLKAVRDFLSAYGEKPSAEPEKNLAVAKPPSEAKPRGKVGIEGYSSYGRTVVAEAMRAMLVDDKPIKSRQLVEFITAMGVEITGENKVNALGALLYRSANIDSHGKAGWTLKDREAAHKIVAEYGSKGNGAAEAAPEAERVAALSSETGRGQDPLFQ